MINGEFISGFLAAIAVVVVAGTIYGVFNSLSYRRQQEAFMAHQRERDVELKDTLARLVHNETVKNSHPAEAAPRAKRDMFGNVD